MIGQVLLFLAAIIVLPFLFVLGVGSAVLTVNMLYHKLEKRDLI